MKKKRKRLFLLSVLVVAIIIGTTAGLVIRTVVINDKDKQEVNKEGNLQQNNSATEDSNIDSEEGSETTQPEENPEDEMIPEPVITTITISAAGDVTMGTHQNQGYEWTFDAEYDEKGETHFFGGVESIFSTDDMTLVNFEAVLTESNNRVEKTFNLRGKPEYMRIMNIGSIEAAGFSNNHCRDYGEESFQDTIDLFELHDISYASDDIVGVYETKDIKIGFVAVNGLKGSIAVDNARTGGTKLDETGVDLKIVYIHWGEEGSHYPNDNQKNWGHQLADMGYDLVLGAHPHVLQGVEVYNNTPIVYSLGNFCFGGNRNPADKNTMIYQQTFTFVDGVLQEELNVKIVPCTISSTDYRNDYRPTIQTGTEKGKEILDLMNEYSTAWGTVFDEDGNLIP